MKENSFSVSAWEKFLHQAMEPLERKDIREQEKGSRCSDNEWVAEINLFPKL